MSKAVTKTQWDEIGFRASEALTLDEWTAIGSGLGKVHRSLPFAIGDWLIHGEATFGEKAAQGIEATGLAYQTLSNYASVARQIPANQRRSSLPWNIHQAVAPLKPVEQERVLDKAEKGALKSNEVRALVAEFHGKLKDAKEGKAVDEKPGAAREALRLAREGVDLLRQKPPDLSRAAEVLRMAADHAEEAAGK